MKESDWVNVGKSGRKVLDLFSIKFIDKIIVLDNSAPFYKDKIGTLFKNV
ncbi:hypothetical protein LEP1GSC049_2238 [Leptospira kirschneri serovar Cynopteri str. 3522 CT]|nr:hypothetical protein LEP1GSC049_2238 [Leptospira kirschneri serovar Cynopteri str. 3522 CT]